MTTPSSRAADEVFTGPDELGVEHQLLGTKPHVTNSAYLHPLTTRLAAMARAATAARQPWHTIWERRILPGLSEPSLGVLVRALQCSQRQRSLFCELRQYDGPEDPAKRLLDADLFNLSSHHWHLVAQLPDDERTRQLAHWLYQNWSEDSHRSMSVTRMPPSCERRRSESLSPSASSPNEPPSSSIGTSGSREKAPDPNLFESSSFTDDNSLAPSEGVSHGLRRKRKHQRQHTGPVYRCLVDDCDHRRKGFVNKGSCESHMRAKHSNWISEHPGWENLLQRTAQSDLSAISTALAPSTPASTFDALNAVASETSTNGAGQMFSSESLDGFANNYATSLHKRQFYDDATAAEESFTEAGTYTAPLSGTTHPVDPIVVPFNFSTPTEMISPSPTSPGLMFTPARQDNVAEANLRVPIIGSPMPSRQQSIPQHMYASSGEQHRGQPGRMKHYNSAMHMQREQQQALDQYLPFQRFHHPQAKQGQYLQDHRWQSRQPRQTLTQMLQQPQNAQYQQPQSQSLHRLASRQPQHQQPEQTQQTPTESQSLQEIQEDYEMYSANPIYQ